MKKILSLVLSLALAVALIPAAFAVEDFADQDQLPSWALDSINYVHQQGYMVGDQAGNFNPNNPVSRAEFIIMLTRVLWPDEVAARPDGDTWWSKHYDIAAEKYLFTITDYLDNKTVAYMTDGIPRQEMAMLLINAVILSGEEIPDLRGLFYIPDLTTTIDVRYQAAVEGCYSMGLILGDESGNFNGMATMSRAESAIVLHRLAEKGQRKAPATGRNPLPGWLRCYTPILQTWNEGATHFYTPKVGDVVVKSDGTRVTLAWGYGDILGAGQGVDPYTGWTGPNGVVIKEGIASPEDQTVYVKDPTTGEMHSSKDWAAIDRATYPGNDVKGAYDREVRNIFYEWRADEDRWEWIGPYFSH